MDGMITFAYGCKHTEKMTNPEDNNRDDHEEQPLEESDDSTSPVESLSIAVNLTPTAAEVLLSKVPSHISSDKIRTTTKIEITVRELYAMVHLLKISDARIAAKYGLSTKTIRNFRRKCGFDSNFKAGSMDLPLREVTHLIKTEKMSYADVAREFNTTKTAVKLFCIRNNIQQTDINWPISRQDLINYTLLELTVDEIADKYDVAPESVSELYAKYRTVPFSGSKTHESLGNSPRIDLDSNPFEGMEVAEIAHCVFGGTFREHPTIGFMLNNRPITAVELSMLVKRLLPPYRVA